MLGSLQPNDAYVHLVPVSDSLLYIYIYIPEFTSPAFHTYTHSHNSLLILSKSGLLLLTSLRPNRIPTCHQAN